MFKNDAWCQFDSGHSNTSDVSTNLLGGAPTQAGAWTPLPRRAFPCRAATAWRGWYIPARRCRCRYTGSLGLRRGWACWTVHGLPHCRRRVSATHVTVCCSSWRRLGSRAEPAPWSTRSLSSEMATSRRQDDWLNRHQVRHPTDQGRGRLLDARAPTWPGPAELGGAACTGFAPGRSDHRPYRRRVRADQDPASVGRHRRR